MVLIDVYSLWPSFQVKVGVFKSCSGLLFVQDFRLAVIVLSLDGFGLFNVKEKLFKLARSIWA